jgi:hypothetical protein
VRAAARRQGRRQGCKRANPPRASGHGSIIRGITTPAKIPPEELYETLRRFKDKVAEDIGENEP